LWLSGATVKIVADKERVSKNTVRRKNYFYLNNPPIIKIPDIKESHLLIDATYFKKNNCLTIYFDHNKSIPLFWRYSSSEAAEEITGDLYTIKEKGIVIKSITSDGHKSIKKAVSIVFPDIFHQRCLVHIERFSLTHLTKRPKTLAGKHLRLIVKILLKIKNYNQKILFEDLYKLWFDKFSNFIKEKSYDVEHKHWWYTHKNLRKVVRHIENALPDMFYYLDDKNIPKTTNGLEGRFNFLKHHLNSHRGLSKSKRKNYFDWYLSTKFISKIK